MTDLDTPSTNTEPEPPATGHPSIWRVVSLAAVIATVVIVAIAVLQARSAGDIAAESDDTAIELVTTQVSVGAIGTDDPAGLVALGLDPTSHTVSATSNGVAVDVPADSPALIGLYATDGSLTGLAIVRGEADRVAIEVSADSTAHALIALSPALLQPDLSLTLAEVDVIAQDPAFDKLVAALTTDSNLSQPNSAVEIATAEILDRVRNRDAFPDQGCDSVLDPRSYAAAGACVQPGDEGVIISNEQDRWALVYASASGELCGAVAPSRSAGSELQVRAGDCGEQATLVAPGPIVDRALDEQMTVGNIRSAGAMQLFGRYAIPLADLAGGAAGFSATANRHVANNAADVIGALDQLAAEDPAFAAAVETVVNPASRIDRHLAGIDTARAVIGAQTDLIPGRVQNSDGYLALLDFYGRAGERMTETRTNWRWTADSVGDIDLSGLES